jgi:hypothetical protein
MPVQTNRQRRNQCQCLSVSGNSSEPAVTGAMVNGTRDLAKHDLKRGVIRPRVLKLAGVFILVFGLQFVFGLQSYAQQPDLDAAAAAKAAAGLEARSHRALDASSLVGTAIGTFVTFDAPGAVDGTVPYSINATGAITGTYHDANFIGHGFLRDSDGVFTTFDVPGDVDGTYAYSINGAGAITGAYCDAITCHGFLRDINGSYSTFDIPGDVYGTVTPLSINSAKAITGTYFDTNFVAHGFLRTSDGAITIVDAPGADTAGFPQTEAEAIDTEGVITGIGAGQIFLRARDGAFTTFDAPGYIDPAFLFTFFAPAALSVNAKGVIAGAYFQPISGNPFGGNYQVFVRALDGAFITFAAATYSPCCVWSWPSGINPAGTITGVINDGFDLNHGFVRTSAGSIGTFNAPGAGPGPFQGTVPLGIDPTGEIMGYYTDINGVDHGFLFTPRP